MHLEYKPNIENAEQVDACIKMLKSKSESRYLSVKRFFDIAFSLFAILVFSLPMLLIFVIIYFDDMSCSPIFVQERVGLNGKIFRMYKFRTMIPNAENVLHKYADLNEMDGPVFKIKNDPRITRFGRFLRTTGLDELPQLFNVIKGDMTVVGPRPPLPQEVARYSEVHMLRLVVTPGITCIWQVQRKRNDILFEEWVKMDIEYIFNRSIFLDIKILFLTVLAVLRRDGR